MSGAFKIVGISGSLRKASFNTAALRACAELMPDGVTFEIVEIGHLPHYNEDLRVNGGFPADVEAFRAKIASADAILFATPEYNYGVTGALKDAIDWGSRPPNQPFAGKPYGMISVTGGILGGARGQLPLRQIMISLDGMPINNPQVYIGNAKEKFDANLNFTDQAGRDFIKQLLVKMVALGRQLKK